MILVITRMKVLSEKRLELSQTIASLSVATRQEEGCRRCELCQSIEDENRLFFLQEWETWDNLSNHMRSDIFSVFRGGAQNLLKEPYEMRLFTDYDPTLQGREETRG